MKAIRTGGLFAECGGLLVVLTLLWLVLCGALFLYGSSASRLGCTLAWAIVSVAVVSGVCLRCLLRDTPVQAVLASSTLRMFVALTGALLVRVWDPRLGLEEFLVWLVGLYLASVCVDLWRQVQSGRERGMGK